LKISAVTFSKKKNNFLDSFLDNQFFLKMAHSDTSFTDISDDLEVETIETGSVNSWDTWERPFVSDNLMIPALEGFRRIFWRGIWMYQFIRRPLSNEFDVVKWDFENERYHKKTFVFYPRKCPGVPGFRRTFTPEYGWILQHVNINPYVESMELGTSEDFLDDAVLYRPVGVNLFAIAVGDEQFHSIRRWDIQNETYISDPPMMNIRQVNVNRLFSEIMDHADDLASYLLKVLCHDDPLFLSAEEII
jgi:hypothetical protein